MNAPLYNHMFDVAFSVTSNEEDPNNVPISQMISALESRINALRKMNENDAREAFGYSDSYEEDRHEDNAPKF